MAADPTKRTGTTPIPALPTPILPTIGGGAPSPIKTFGAAEEGGGGPCGWVHNGGDMDPGWWSWTPCETGSWDGGGGGPTGSGSGPGGGGGGGLPPPYGPGSTGGKKAVPLPVTNPCASLSAGFSASEVTRLPSQYAGVSKSQSAIINAAIINAAKTYGINPLLLMGIGIQESHMGVGGGYNRKTGTGDGGHGRGLWQIDDGFGKDPPLSLTDAELLQCQTDPAFCAMQAAKLLAFNLKKYGGNLTKAIQAYNGTPGTPKSNAYSTDVCGYIQEYAQTAPPPPPNPPTGISSMNSSWDNMGLLPTQSPDLSSLDYDSSSLDETSGNMFFV